MPNGGELEIATRFLPRNQQVEILFSDSGAGIAPNVVEHLFEPMFTTKQSGSGLGLVIAREIVAEHRGRIELVSGSSGAVFCWRSRWRSRAPRQRTTLRWKQMPRKAPHILVVDDDTVTLRAPL